MRRKYLIWIKRKKKKRLRHKHNFFFFFTKRKKFFPRFSSKWFRFQRKKKKSYISIFNSISNNLSFFFKFRYPRRLKKSLKKKLALKYKFKIYYKLFSEKKFRKLKKKIAKKKNKIFFLFHFLESRLPSICLRFHFFWTIKSSFFWIDKGVISVNGLIKYYTNYRINLNDNIAIVGPPALWKNRLTKIWGVRKYHMRFYKSINYSELSYICVSGILLKLPFKIKEIKLLLKKRRKIWIKFKTFLYLTHNFI